MIFNKYKYRTAALFLAAVLAAVPLPVLQPVMAAAAAPSKTTAAAEDPEKKKTSQNESGKKETEKKGSTEKNSADHSSSEKNSTEKNSADHSSSEKNSTEKNSADHSSSEKKSTEKDSAETNSSENSGADSTGTPQTETENSGQSSSGEKGTEINSTEIKNTEEKNVKEKNPKGSETDKTEDSGEPKKEEAPAVASPYDSPLEFKYIYTKDGIEDLPAERAANKAQPPQTNIDPAWPQGPSIGAAGAVVMDADSGEVLYAKNMYMHLYPASITKVMTALLAYENLRPTDRVTFSENAVFGIERGSSNIGMDVDESITVEEALYGLMVASANEVAVALGERVSGSETAFVNLMNLRAEELGCRNTHFVTTNGLHDKDHYTCAYDMALIAREAYRHPDLIEYMSQANYHFEPSDDQPDDFWIGNTNSFLNGVISCDDVIGGKTGYTDEARETLVSFAEHDGKRLICVIMREEPPHQYYDTIDLLEYAYDNFQPCSVAREENRFTMQENDFLSFGTDIFGNSRPAFTVDSSAVLMLPKNASFSDLTASILPFTYEGLVEGTAEISSAGSTAASQDDPASPDAAKSDRKGPAGESAENTPEDPSHTTKDGTRILGRVQYQYHAYDLGTVNILFTPSADAVEAESSTASAEAAEADKTSATAGTGTSSETAEIDLPKGSSRAAGGPAAPEEVHGIRSLFFALVHTGAHGSIYLNILLFLPLLLAAAFLLCVIFWIRSYYAELKRRRSRKRRRAVRAQQQPSLKERSSKGQSLKEQSLKEQSLKEQSLKGRYPDRIPSNDRSSGRRTSGNGARRQGRPK